MELCGRSYAEEDFDRWFRRVYQHFGSPKGYEVLPDAYDDMVDVVKDDVASLEKRLGRSFGWADIWKTQRSQCKRDGVCRGDLIPRAPASSRPPGSRRFPGSRPPG